MPVLQRLSYNILQSISCHISILNSLLFLHHKAGDTEAVAS